jgi:Flp pilus assembly protein TadG
MSIRRRRAEGEDGASAVEFALLVIPFAFLLFGLIQFGFYFWSAQTTSAAARETARRVVVGDCWDAGQRTAFASSQAPMMTGSATLSADPATLNVGDEITITLTGDSEVINFFPFIPDTVEGKFDARMEQIDDSGMCG